MQKPILQAIADFDDDFQALRLAQKAALKMQDTEEGRERWLCAIEATEEAQNLTDAALTNED